MRHRADDNQSDIIKALESMGVSVRITSGVGFGFTDFVTGFRGINDLVEIKSPVWGKLTPAQKKFHAEWKGHILTFTSAEEAVDYYLTRQPSAF